MEGHRQQEGGGAQLLGESVEIGAPAAIGGIWVFPLVPRAVKDGPVLLPGPGALDSGVMTVEELPTPTCRP